MNLVLGVCVCIFKTVRIVSSILFALMAVVLPMAGAQKYVCTMDMTFSGNADECPMNGDDCGKGNSEMPDCMIAADLVPDAEPPNLAQIPFLKSEEVIYLRLSMPEFNGSNVVHVCAECRHDPPDSRAWYVQQQRLLI